MFLLYIYFVINYLLVYLISVDTPGFRPVRIRTGRPTCEDPENYDVDHEFAQVSIMFVLFYWLFVWYDWGLFTLKLSSCVLEYPMTLSRNMIGCSIVSQEYCKLIG